MLQFLKKPRACAEAGQYVSFDGESNVPASSKNKKILWRQSDASEIVRQITEKQDQTDSTIQSSTFFTDDQDEFEKQQVAHNGENCPDHAKGISSKTDAHLHSDTEEETSEDFHTASNEHPLWLKRHMFADICGNHALVNAERHWGNPDLSPLKRSCELDEIAKWHAENMAKASRAFHSDPNELCSRLATKPQHRLGENVAQGKNLRELHGIMKQHSANYANMMDERYTEMGMASARAANGDWYLCQIFRGWSTHT